VSAPRARWRRLLAAALLAFAVVPAAACSLDGPPPPSVSADPGNVGLPGPVRIAPADRVAAPDLSGPTVAGGTDSLAHYRGRVLVVNVWGALCDPCRAEAPGLARVARDFKARGVSFLGIDSRDLSEAQAAAFQRRFALPYPSLYDPQGRMLLRFPRGSVNPQAIPATLVLDRQGRIAAHYLGALSETALRAMLTPLLTEPPSSGSPAA
jgi:peroxiredoxin